MKILVVDDTLANSKLIARFLDQMGHQVVVAGNGQEGIERFQADMPDMILMDVMMPVMDGYAATARIRQLLDTRWIPIIFLTALNQDADLVKGLAVGGDDFLPKPVNLTVLEAKINSMQRIANLQKQLAEKNQELEKYYFRTEEDQRIGKHIMQWITRTLEPENLLIRHQVRSADYFCGDLLISCKTPGQDLHILHADAVGHGLAAAINVLPLSEAFHSMTKKGFGIQSIAKEMNLKIREFMPVERFVAATLIAVNRRDQVIEIWNGGMPDPLLLDPHGVVLHSWQSAHPPLGIMNDQLFSSRTKSFHYDDDCQLCLFSDGLDEAESPQGERFGKEYVAELLCNTEPASRFDRLIEELDKHLAGRTAHDDISIAILDIPCESEKIEPQEYPFVQHRDSGGDYHWTFEMCMGASELKYLEVVPMVTEIVSKICVSGKHNGALFLILSELFNNALDHGILGLDSAIKSGEDGLENYWQQRSCRLQALTSGSIQIRIKSVVVEDRRGVIISVKDSGPGFDHSAFMSENLSDNAGFHGRGIALVNTLAYSLEYPGSGNEAVCCYLPGESGLT